jgi:hypothetical protein
VNCATYDLPRDKWDVNLDVAAPKYVNPNTTHTGSAQRRVEGHDITAKCSKIDGAGRVYHPKFRKITSRGRGCIERNRAERGDNLGVVVFVGAFYLQRTGTGGIAVCV